MKVPWNYIGSNPYIDEPLKGYICQALADMWGTKLHSSWLNCSGDEALIEALEQETEEGMLLWQETLKHRILS